MLLYKSSSASHSSSPPVSSGSVAEVVPLAPAAVVEAGVETAAGSVEIVETVGPAAGTLEAAALLLPETGAEGEEAGEEAAADEDEPAEAEGAAPHTPVGVEIVAATPAVGVSPVRTQPDFWVISEGQATVSQLTVGLSAPWKKEPQRKEQPG